MDHAAGWPIYHVRPKAAAARRHGVYVHGGAWINEIARQHWNLVLDTVVRAGVGISVPIYPLAPRGTAADVVPRIAGRLVAAMEDHGADRVFVMGDSAGGQIALSAAVLLRDQGRPPLGDTILISPALDLTFSNPAIEAVERRDPWLARAGIRDVAVELWRGELDVEDPRVSPLFADLSGLGPVAVFSGTRDITNPDTRRLVEKLEAAGVPVAYHEEKDLIHVYPLLYGPKARRACSLIVNRLARP